MTIKILTKTIKGGRIMNLYFDEEQGNVIAEMQDSKFQFRFNDEYYENSAIAMQRINTGDWSEVEVDVDEIWTPDILTPHRVDAEKEAEKEATYRKYTVYLHTPESGLEIVENIKAHEGYTAQEYLKDCRENASKEHIEWIESGELSLFDVENERWVEE